MPSVISLYRYPIKGMSGALLDQIELRSGEGAPFDRIYAIENGGPRFDSQQPKWLPKVNFLMLMRNERMATLLADFREDSHTLTLFREGKQLAKGCLATKLGRQMIEQFLAAYFEAELKGPPRIVSAEGHQFTDIADKALHLVNLETVRDASRALGEELDPLRFRANIYFDGVPAWQERQWVGKTITIGGATLKVFAETGRCEATSVDPKTAYRGPSIPSAMERMWGHTKLGFYASVVSGAVIRPGDSMTVSELEAIQN